MVKRTHDFTLDTDSFNRLLPKEPKFDDTSPAKKVKQEVNFLCLRDLKQFTGPYLQILYKNRFLHDTPPCLANERYIRYNLNGEMVVNCLVETLSGKQHLPFDESIKDQIRDKLSGIPNDVVEWILDKLAFWNYAEWDENYLLSVLRKEFGELMNGFEEFHIDGKTLDRIIDILSEGYSKLAMLDMVKHEFPQIESSHSQFTILYNWIELYLFTHYRSKQQNIQNILSCLEEEGTKQDYEQDSTPFVYQEQEMKDCLLYASDRLSCVPAKTGKSGTILIVQGEEGSGKSRFVNELPKYLQTCIKGEEYEYEYSETHQLIDIRMKFNNEMDPTPQQVSKLSLYFKARIFHSYFKYVRPFKWPGTEGMTDCQFIQKVMDDLELYYCELWKIADWISTIEQTYHNEKKIWVHFTIEDLNVLASVKEIEELLQKCLIKFGSFDFTCAVSLPRNNSMFWNYKNGFFPMKVSIKKLSFEKIKELQTNIGLPDNELITKVLLYSDGNAALIVKFGKLFKKHGDVMVAYEELCQSCQSELSLKKDELRIIDIFEERTPTKLGIPIIYNIIEKITKHDETHLFNIFKPIPNWHLPIQHDPETLRRIFQLCIHFQLVFGSLFRYSVLRDEPLDIKNIKWRESDIKDVDWNASNNTVYWMKDSLMSVAVKSEKYWYLFMQPFKTVEDTKEMKSLFEGKGFKYKFIVFSKGYPCSDSSSDVIELSFEMYASSFSKLFDYPRDRFSN